MKRTEFLAIHAIQTVIYLLLAIAMSFIKDKNSDDKMFMAFYTYIIAAVIVCVFVLIVVLFICIIGDDYEE